MPEVVDPTTDQFGPTGFLRTARYLHTAAQLKQQSDAHPTKITFTLRRANFVISLASGSISELKAIPHGFRYCIRIISGPSPAEKFRGLGLPWLRSVEILLRWHPFLTPADSREHRRYYQISV
jgi:hypothetical protein